VSVTVSPIQVSLLMASALLAAVIGVLVTLRRGHWLTTLVFSASFLSMAAFQAGTLGILRADSRAALNWAIYLARTSALASWLWLSLSVVLARSDPWRQIRNAGAYLTLGLVGCLGMSSAAGSPYVVKGVTGQGGSAVVMFGTMGKIYLMYLVIVMVAVLMNLERMLRTSPASAQRRLRPMFVAFLVGILSELLVVSAGLLYSGLRVTWLVASAAPMFVSGVVTALALARRRLSDVSVPMARPVIYYSSVSLTIAGIFMLTMAVLSKLLPILSPESRHAVSLAFYLLAGGGGLLLTLSPRANRAVKRFIDRNFYANRYDYRREWERVSNSIAPTARPEDLCRQIEALVASVFDTERIAIYLRDTTADPMRLLHGPAAMPANLTLENPLLAELERSRRPMVLREVAHDLDLIPVAVENRATIRAVSAAVVAPLLVGEHLLGLLWLSEKQNDEEYTYEDVEFLGTMARQLAATLSFARQAELLAETRQLESLHRLSSFVLHDIKNQVSGLSLVVENARRHLANPEFQRDAMAVVERTVMSLRELMSQVAGVARPPEVRPEPCRLPDLIDEAVQAAGLEAGEREGIMLRRRGPAEEQVIVDRRLMMRVIVNLLVNAREAIGASGEIDLGVEVTTGGRRDGPVLELMVRDTGRGMTDEFVRTALFKPFASTKAGGLGVGLAQCKAIVEAHGGSITVESKVGRGTTFKVRVPLPAAPAGAGDAGARAPAAEPREAAR
jgi:putative PEP-CTERM system histidine kinase